MEFFKTPLITLLFILILTSCRTEKAELIIKNEDEITDETELPVNITIDGLDVTDFYKGCQLTSIHEEIPINNDSLRIKSEINDNIQTFFINDANNIYMMSRVPNTQLNKKIEIDIVSTTFALVTLHPLFSSMTADEFVSMENLVTSNPFYQTLRNEVEKIVKEKKDIYDTSNSTLISALDNLVNNICSSADLPIDSIATESISRAVYNHPQINPNFIEASINENKFTLSTRWWTPSYFGSIVQPDSTVINQAILARDDFGALDLLFNRTLCGPPMEHKFKEPGDYIFSFSRTHPLAILDFYLRLAKHFISYLGLNIDNTYLKREAEYFLKGYEDLGVSLSDTKISALEFVGIMYDLLIIQMKENPEEVAKIFGIKEPDKMKNFAKMCSKITKWYDAAKIAADFIGRLTMALAAPNSFDFTHTYPGEVSLKIIEGNEQIGLKNKKLELPLTVEIIDTDSISTDKYTYKVLFEIVSGGGKIHKEHIFLDREHVALNGFKAKTEWTLGIQGEQKIKATVIDVISGDNVSAPVYFTADLTNFNLKKVTGDNQLGFPNVYLKEALGIQIEMDKEYPYPLHKYYEIKYEVVSGNGKVSETTKSPDSNNYTETQWKLGDNTEQEQTVKAVLIDKDSQEELSEPVYYNAYFKKNDEELREALIKLYQSTNGDNWINNDNWCSDKPITEWYGVSYGYKYEGGKSLHLSLGNNGLTGKIDQTFPDDMEIYLIVWYNQLTSLNVSGSTSLVDLNCDHNQLTSLNVSGCTSLNLLDCSSNQLTSLNVSGCTSLYLLHCSFNQLTSLNVSGSTSLKLLSCFFNQLTSLNVSGCTSLVDLNCDDNQLTSLNVSGSTSLHYLWCCSNQLTSLNVSSCTSLVELYCIDNQLTSLNVSGCTSLVELSCGHNQLTSLNVSGCTSLVELGCGHNQLTSLNVSGCTSLHYLWCSFNQLTSLNVSSCTSLVELSCGDNNIKSEIPDWFLQLERFIYDQRYTYWTEEINNKAYRRYKDNGVGWWYPGEPQKGSHSR